MNEKEIAEIRRRHKPEKHNISRIRGCYVDAKKDTGIPYILSEHFPEDFKKNLLKEIPYISALSSSDRCLK